MKYFFFAFIKSAKYFIAALVLSVFISYSASCAIQAIPKADTTYTLVIGKCKADLAKRLKTEVKNIKILNKEEVRWTDSSLGLPKFGEMSLKMITSGLRLTLGHANSVYVYHTSKNAFRYAGTVHVWKYSLLFIENLPNDPNMNGNLYQCSLLGTNSDLILSDVSDYYPQENGVIIAKRRTSRSFHDLIYINPDDKSDSKTIYTAVDFIDASVNQENSKWAAFAKTGMGQPWSVVVGKSGDEKSDNTTTTIALPDGFKPDKLAWENGSLLILGSIDSKTVSYSIISVESDSEWKESPVYSFPGTREFVLNKSESLVIEQVDVNGQPAVEIATVWFTGDKEVSALIKNLKLKSFDLLDGRYVIIQGERLNKQMICVVNFVTGEVISEISWIDQNVKGFAHPANDMTFIKFKSGK